jgi:hypothetical protein
MNNFTNSVGGGAFSGAPGSEMHARMLRSMAGATAAAVALSGVVAPWRVTAGLLLGGLLSLLNHHWMRGSIVAMFRVATEGVRPRISVAKYVLRYFAIGFLVYVAYRFKVVSLPATIAGLCSFVVALFVEAFREFVFIILHREEVR